MIAVANAIAVRISIQSPSQGYALGARTGADVALSEWHRIDLIIPPIRHRTARFRKRTSEWVMVQVQVQ
jgi:hypothetical protein